MFRENILRQVKSFESEPYVVKGCFNKEEVEKLLSIERKSSYFVDRVDGRKASIGYTGSVPVRQIDQWNHEVKDIVYPKMKSELGSFDISNTEFPPHFFKVNFPTRIHADTGIEGSTKIFKQIMVPLDISPIRSEAHTIIFKNRWYGQASFFVGKDYNHSEKNNQGHIKDNEGNFVYIKDIHSLQKIVKSNIGKIIKYENKKFSCTAKLNNDLDLLLNNKRYNSVTSDHIDNNLPFDKNTYKKYLTHHKYEDLYDLEVNLIYKWELGDMLVWDRTLLHASDNFALSRNSHKTGLAIFTCKT